MKSTPLLSTESIPTEGSTFWKDASDVRKTGQGASWLDGSAFEAHLHFQNILQFSIQSINL